METATAPEPAPVAGSEMAQRSGAKLGIIAGGGDLPALLVAACKSANRPYTLIAIEDAAQAAHLGEHPALWMRLGAAADGFARLKEDGVKDVVLAGKVDRPSMKSLLPDWRTAKFIARLGARALTDPQIAGDDKLLRAVIAEIEEEGFAVIAVGDVVPDLVAKEGVLGTVAPTQADQTEITSGFRSAHKLGRDDVGQAVVIKDGVIIGTEGQAGTDALIKQCATPPNATAQGPILVKAKKPNQDPRADMPAIGPETVVACAAAGFRGIAVEAGGTLILHRDDVAAAADKAGLFVTALAPQRDG